MSTRKNMDVGELYRKTFSEFKPDPSKGGFDAVQEMLRLKKLRLARIRTAVISGTTVVALVIAWALWPGNPEPENFRQQDLPPITQMESSGQDTPDSVEPATNDEQPAVNVPATEEDNEPAEEEGLTVTETDAADEPAAAADIASVDATRMNGAATGREQDEEARPEQVNGLPVSVTPSPVERPDDVIWVSSDTVICLGESVTLMVEGGVAYEWSDGSRGPAITVAPGITTTYILAVTDEYQAIHDYTIRVSVRDCAELAIPNAFTPNYDNSNDIFAPVGRPVAAFNMQIYARNGQLIYETNDFLRGWDGQVNGQPGSEGVYVYRISYVNRLGQRVVKQGTVTLLR